MTEQTCRVRAADPRVKGIIRHILSPDESEILRGALEALQFTLWGSCGPSKSILSANTDFAVFSRFFNMACRSQMTSIEEMERVRDGS